MQFIEFIVTQSSLDNGRLYFENTRSDFFPSDAIGGRGANEHAKSNITIDTAGESVLTDIRVSSAVRLSPRKSFKNWLHSQQATADGKARLYCVSERSYKLEYLG